MGWLDKVLWLIQRIFLHVEEAKAKDENKKAQKIRDSIENDPFEWWSSNYGVQHSTDGESQEAEEANEAQSGDSEA